MSPQPGPPTELRARLRDWFVDELSVTDPDVPVASPPSATIPLSAPVRQRRGSWSLVAAAACVVAVIAGFAVLTQRDVDRVPSVSSPPPPDPMMVAPLMTAACAELHGAAATLPLGADAEQVEQVGAGILAALARADSALAAARGNPTVDDVRDLLDELRSRVADLPSVAATADRATFDQTVTNVDLLVLAVGRRMAQAGGAGCTELATMRERP